MRAKQYFSHLKRWDRVKIFFRSRRRMFLYLFLFILAFNFLGNVVGFFLARLERSARKYKKQWIMGKNPSLITYSTAMDTMYVPMKISQQSTDRLGDLFLRIDRDLKEGVSRGFLVKALLESGLITDKQQVREILGKSTAYNTVQGQVRQSLSMKEFYQIIEGLVKPDHSDELDKVNHFSAKFDILSLNFDQMREKEYAKIVEDLKTE